MLALDWSKAFDSIHVESLLDALRRFGIPQPFCQMIRRILEARRFYVEECGQPSETRGQLSGISQGCTISPLLFIIVMSVLLHDAVSSLSDEAKAAYKKGHLADLVYADDTLLMGVSAEFLEEYLAAVSKVGMNYGMQLHFQKIQLLSTASLTRISVQEDEQITTKPVMDYLGACLSWMRRQITS